MKFHFSLALSLALLASFAVADSKQQIAEDLFKKAADHSGPLTAIKGPYRIQYKLIFYDSQTGAVEGSYSRIWLSRHQWRREVSMPEFSEVSVSDGPSTWIERKPHLFEPSNVSRFLGSLESSSSPRLNPNDLVSKVKEETKGPARMQCVETRNPLAPPPIGDKSFCFDATNGAIVRLKEADLRTEFSDFESGDGAVIARKVQQFRGKELVAEGQLITLSSQELPARGLLDHSANARQFSNCDGKVTPGKLIQHKNPEYPAVARMAHQEGTVQVYVVIDVDGKPKDIEIVRGASKLLNDAALEAIRQWRYQPYICDGIPVQVESVVDTNFNLAH